MSPTTKDRRQHGRGPTASWKRRRVRGVGRKLHHIRLKGKSIVAHIDTEITDATIERTISGASTITIVCHDPLRRMQTKALKDDRIDVEIEGLWFRLVHLSKSGEEATITFEDREVAEMRNPDTKGPEKAYRDKVTRAQFVKMLVRKVKNDRIPLYIPELNEVQPIAGGKHETTIKLDSTDQKGGKQSKGINGGHLTVKGEPATSSQVSIGERALSAADQMGAPWQAQAALMVALIVESLVGKVTSNLLEQIPSTAACSGASPSDPKECAQAFMKGWCGGEGAIAAAKHEGNNIAGIAQDVQKSGAGQASHGAANYGPYVHEAVDWVKAFNGGDLPKGATGATITTYKRYAFEQKKKETSWAAIQRLAQEVKWDAFVSAGVFYYVEEQQLFQQKPAMVIDEDSPGIDSIDFEYDMGKKNTTLTVRGRARQWAAPPGTVVKIRDGFSMPEVCGNYIVKTIRGSFVNDDVEIDIAKPTKPKPEPAPEKVQKSVQYGDGSNSGGSFHGKLAGHWRPGSSVYKGVTICNWIIDIIKAAEADVGPLQPTSGVRPGYDSHTQSGLSAHSGCAKGSGPGTGAVDFGGYDGSADADKFRGWLAKRGWPMRDAAHATGGGYHDLGHFSRDGH